MSSEEVGSLVVTLLVLLACLHGFGHLHEACVQLRGEGGARQVPGAEVAAVGVGAANSGTTALLLTTER